MQTEKCVEFEDTERSKTLAEFPIFTPPPKSTKIIMNAPMFSTGGYLPVAKNNMPGTNSNGRFGWIIAVGGKGGKTTITVQYNKCLNNTTNKSSIALEGVPTLLSLSVSVPRERRAARSNNMGKNILQVPKVRRNLSRYEKKKVLVPVINKLKDAYISNKGKG